MGCKRVTDASARRMNRKEEEGEERPVERTRQRKEGNEGENGEMRQQRLLSHGVVKDVGGFGLRGMRRVSDGEGGKGRGRRRTDSTTLGSMGDTLESPILCQSLPERTKAVLHHRALRQLPSKKKRREGTH